MLRDLKLENEIPLFRLDGQDRDFSYVPTSDGPFEAKLSDGSIAFARTSSRFISHGKLLRK